MHHPQVRITRRPPPADQALLEAVSCTQSYVEVVHAIEERQCLFPELLVDFRDGGLCKARKVTHMLADVFRRASRIATVINRSSLKELVWCAASDVLNLGFDPDYAIRTTDCCSNGSSILLRRPVENRSNCSVIVAMEDNELVDGVAGFAGQVEKTDSQLVTFIICWNSHRN